MADIVELDQIEALAPYRQQWDRLLLRTPGAAFFQSLDWLVAYWRHYGEGRRLRVLLIIEGGEIRAIVPLVLRRCMTRLGPMRMIVWPLDAWGTFFGPIGPDPVWATSTAIDYLRSGPRDWDLIDLKHLGTAEPDADSLWGTRLSSVSGCTYRAEERTAVIDFDGSWDGYLRSRSSHWRRNFRAAEQRLMLRGDVRFERFRPDAANARNHSDSCTLNSSMARAAPANDGSRLRAALGESASWEQSSSTAVSKWIDPRWDLFDACRQVAAASWQASAARGTTLSSPSIVAFLRDVHQAAAMLGALDVCLLWCDERPVAFQYNYYWNGRLFGLRQGYDPQFARYSVGVVLMGMAVRDSFARGDRLLDLGTGSIECKTPLATRMASVGRLTYYPSRALRAQLLHLGRWLRRRWDAAGKV